MRFVYGLTHFKPLNKKPAVALGVFDGLHRAHQKIIANLIKEAKRLKTLSLVVTFFPHPQKESSLYPLSYRLRLLEEAGVDLCLIIRFSPAFRKIPAKEFLQRILVKKINPKVVLVGKNFTFGKNAKGNWRMLEDFSKKAKFKLRVIDVLTYKGMPISSSYIRALIKKGDFRRAEDLLGRPVSIFGRVTGGWHLGRVLGYPTANVIGDHEILPPFGVYAVRVKVEGRWFEGICYIGTRPTLKPAPFYCAETLRSKKVQGKKTAGKANIEVHIFNFKNNLYGCKMQVELIKRIRPQKRFSSIQALTCQIKRDICLCHSIFK